MLTETTAYPVHKMTDPLRRCLPPKREVQLEPDMDMVRKFKGLPPLAKEPKKAPLAIVDMNPVIHANDHTDADIRRSYSNLENGEEFAANMPAMPEMVGVGRYRMAVNVIKQDQVASLRRTVSDLDPSLVTAIGELGIVDKDIFQDVVSENGSEASSPRPTTPAPFEYFDKRRGSVVKCGFSPSSMSTSYNSGDGALPNRRKSSSATSGEVDPNVRVRQYSNTKSELSSPLRTISELAALDTARVEKPCVFGEHGDPDSAVASDEEDDWADETMLESFRAPNVSLLTQSLRKKEAVRRPGARQSFERVRPAQKNAQGPADSVRARHVSRPQFARHHSRVYNRAGTNDHFGSANVDVVNTGMAEQMTMSVRPPPVAGSLAASPSTWETMKSNAATGMQQPAGPVKRTAVAEHTAHVSTTVYDNPDSGSDDDNPPSIFLVSPKQDNNDKEKSAGAEHSASVSAAAYDNPYSDSDDDSPPSCFMVSPKADDDEEENLASRARNIFQSAIAWTQNVIPTGRGRSTTVIHRPDLAVDMSTIAVAVNVEKESTPQ